MNYILRRAVGMGIFIGGMWVLRLIFKSYWWIAFLVIFVSYAAYILKKRWPMWKLMAQTWHDEIERKILEGGKKKDDKK